MAIRRRELGGTHLDTLRSLRQAAKLANAESRYEEGEGYLREVVEAARSGLGAEDPFTLATMNLLGVLMCGLQVHDAHQIRRDREHPQMPRLASARQGTTLTPVGADVGERLGRLSPVHEIGK